MKQISLLLDGSRYFARVDGGPKFYVGDRVSYQGLKGLMNVKGTPEQRYDPTHSDTTLPALWLKFIWPTATAEGAYFHTLNTYDKAAFTFGFLQYAAHVPDGDFVRYLRALLGLPLAAEYFPDLRLSGERIHRVRDHGLEPLETAQSTQGLMNYLNPSTAQVEDTEVIQAARFIHWVQNDPAHRAVQVHLGVTHMRDALARYGQSYTLDGRTLAECVLVTDVRHQGRASSQQIRQALLQARPVDALLALGADRYPERIKSLKGSLKALEQDPDTAGKRWSRQAQDFV